MLDSKNEEKSEKTYHPTITEQAAEVLKEQGFTAQVYPMYNSAITDQIIVVRGVKGEHEH
jgi:hypothetical protein